MLALKNHLILIQSRYLTKRERMEELEQKCTQKVRRSRRSGDKEANLNRAMPLWKVPVFKAGSTGARLQDTGEQWRALLERCAG
jgi:hypothetical protein